MDSIAPTPLTDCLVIGFTYYVHTASSWSRLPPSGSRASAVQAFVGGTAMAAEATSSLVFTGPLTWTTEAACKGQTRLFFAPAGERPEARVVRESSARTVCHACP